ncbi:hypothetical protein MCUN1_000278 [Malassezia cuniculi]|uniref:Uncharacterized protein n=1 Tax=Malassezia cuniculi TaxID=948313 RepID=A0AAF0J4W4_9BASI|nr:hypothetical protein MCUN1_000278 [Malassezia cuniculi]
MLRPALAAVAAAGERAEARFAASPYCVYFVGVLTDFLVQLKVVHSPSGLVYVPDGVLHPKFAQRRLGKGVWVCADQFVFRTFTETPLVPSKLGALVTVQLKQRVVQEAQLLAERPAAAFAARKSDVPAAFLDFCAHDGSKAADSALRRAAGAPDASTHVPAEADSAAQALPRTWSDPHVPTYHMCRAINDEQARAVHGYLEAAGVFNSGVLAASRETVPLAVALWRLASWLESDRNT